MENTLKKALDQIKADDILKQKTAEYVFKTETNMKSFHRVATRRKYPAYVRRLAVAACAAVVLCALPIGGYAYYQTPTSYVSVDINPSIELGINSFGKVITVTAFNTDGETVLAGLSILNANVENAVKQIVKSASQNGFIKDDGSTFISVTAETNNEQKAEKLKQDAQTGAEEAVKSENDTATIESSNIALDNRDDAIALGITPGKLNLIQKLQELDPEVKTEDFKDASVSEIQNRYNELKNGHHDKTEDNGDENNVDDDNVDETASPSSEIPQSENPAPSAPSSQGGSGKPGSGNHNGNGKGDDNTTFDPSDDNSVPDDDQAPDTTDDHDGTHTHGDYYHDPDYDKDSWGFGEGN